MIKSHEKQLNVNSLDLVKEFCLSGDEEWFYSELKEMLLNCGEEIPLEWFSFFRGKTALQSVYGMKIISSSTESIILEFKLDFTEDFKVTPYDMNSKALREGHFILQINKSDGKIILSPEPSG